MTTCPYCHYTRKPTDNTPDWECPNCQRAYLKSAREQQFQELANQQASANFIKVTIDGKNFLEPGSELQFDGALEVDSVAVQCKWLQASNLLKTGLNIGYDIPRELIEVSATRLEFSAGKATNVLGCLMIVGGVGGAIAILSSVKTSSIVPILFAIAMSLAFIAIGLFSSSLFNKPVIFDKSKGCFWKGGKSDLDSPSINSVDEFIWFKDIYALQLIYWDNPYTRRRASDKIIEINLVMTNSRRVNINLYYDNESVAREHATTLSAFLGKPVWDAIESTRRYWISRR